MTENNENTHDDHIDALNAMAGGGEITDPQEPDEQDNFSTEPAFDETESAIDIGVSVDPERARRTRQTGMQRRLKKAHAEQFKRIMIPMLLAVGTMLLLVSFTTVLMMQSHNSENGKFMGGFGWPMAVGSFLLAAILMLGAWMFYNETKNNQK